MEVTGFDPLPSHTATTSNTFLFQHIVDGTENFEVTIEFSQEKTSIRYYIILLTIFTHHNLRTLHVFHSHLLITIIIVVIVGYRPVRLLWDLGNLLERLGGHAATRYRRGRRWWLGGAQSGRDPALDLLSDDLSRWRGGRGRLWGGARREVLIFVCVKSKDLDFVKQYKLLLVFHFFLISSCRCHSLFS